IRLSPPLSLSVLVIARNPRVCEAGRPAIIRAPPLCFINSLQRRNMHTEHRHSNNGRDCGAKTCDADCYPIGACQGPPMSQEDASETAADKCDEEKCRQRIMGNQSRVP